MRVVCFTVETVDAAAIVALDDSMYEFNDIQTLERRGSAGGPPH
jgi:hypothetical protein